MIDDDDNDEDDDDNDDNNDDDDDDDGTPVEWMEEDFSFIFSERLIKSNNSGGASQILILYLFVGFGFDFDLLRGTSITFC